MPDLSLVSTFLKLWLTIFEVGSKQVLSKDQATVVCLDQGHVSVETKCVGEVQTNVLPHDVIVAALLDQQMKRKELGRVPFLRFVPTPWL